MKGNRVITILGAALMAGGAALWGYRLLWAAGGNVCSPVKATEFAPFL